jgi:hypothetical protein
MSIENLSDTAELLPRSLLEPQGLPERRLPILLIAARAAAFVMCPAFALCVKPSRVQS